MPATAPLRTHCPRCGVTVLQVRWDWQENTIIGEPILDPVALDQTQILASVLTGIPLWQIQPRLGSWVTSQRGRWWPTGPTPGHTVPEHACGRHWAGPPVRLAHDPATAFTECPY